MDFLSRLPIYLQIGEDICEKILKNVWNENEKILSIRDMAISIEVNPNTVARTYADLESKKIINKHRGLGYFVSKSAKIHILNLKRKIFMQQELPIFFKTIDFLGISFKELKILYNQTGNRDEKK
jgi:DNA-binding transcriptional regulator YhcF (GntR family)